MEKFTILDNAVKESPALLQVFVGEDAAAALAKAQEIAPELTAGEFSTYRTERTAVYTEAQDLTAVFQKAGEDAVFAAKLDTCEDCAAVYSLAKGAGLVTISEERFAAVYEQFRQAWDASHPADTDELTEGELASVVGGASIWRKVGSWIKKNYKAVIGGAVGVVTAAVGIAAAIICHNSGGSSSAGESLSNSIVSVPSVSDSYVKI